MEVRETRESVIWICDQCDASVETLYHPESNSAPSNWWRVIRADAGLIDAPRDFCGLECLFKWARAVSARAMSESRRAREWTITGGDPGHNELPVLLVDGREVARVSDLVAGQFIVNACSQHEARLSMVGHPVRGEEGPE